MPCQFLTIEGRHKIINDKAIVNIDIFFMLISFFCHWIEKYPSFQELNRNRQLDMKFTPAITS